jgi:hypothetical protein
MSDENPFVVLPLECGHSVSVHAASSVFHDFPDSDPEWCPVCNGPVEIDWVAFHTKHSTPAPILVYIATAVYDPDTVSTLGVFRSLESAKAEVQKHVDETIADDKEYSLYSEWYQEQDGTHVCQIRFREHGLYEYYTVTPAELRD